MRHTVFPLVCIQTRLTTILRWEAVELIGRYHALMKSARHILPVGCDAIVVNEHRVKKACLFIGRQGLVERINAGLSESLTWIPKVGQWIKIIVVCQWCEGF
jgi:hypothetical protein